MRALISERMGQRVDNWEESRVKASGAYGTKPSARYLSERPCKNHGDSVERYTGSGICVQCVKKPRKFPSSPGISRGNVTSGSQRRGFKGGRARLHPIGTVLHLVSIQLTDSECATLIHLGYGVMARGVRRAIELALAHHPLPADCPTDSRFTAEIYVKDQKAKRRIQKMMDASPAIPENEWDDIP